MRTILLSAFTTLALAACGGAKANQPVANSGSGSAAPTAAAADTTEPEQKPGSTSFPDECCCTTASGTTMEFDGPAACTQDKGTCSDQWTDECSSEAEDQEAADSRAKADDECSSGDRHDCDGDGVRDDEDKDDNDPKVH